MMPDEAVPPRKPFELNAEAIAALRAALADDPEKLKRLEERLVCDKERAARRTALERRIALLLSRNAALRAAVQPPPGQTDATVDALDEFDESAVASTTSSTSPGNTVSSHNTRDRVTRGPSPSSPTVVPAAAAAATTAAPQPCVDEFDESTIHADTPPVPDTWGRQQSVFRYAGPSVRGMVSSVIGDGVLYRIITDRGEWAFYSDTRYYVVQVRYRVLGGSAVTPGPSVTVNPVGADQELSMELGPEETKVLLKGNVIDFENLSAASLLPERAATAAEECLLSREPQMDWKVIAAAYPPLAAASKGKGSGSSSSSNGADLSKIKTEELLAFCMDQHIRFVDPAFFPCHASLYRYAVDTFFVAPLHWRSPFTYLPDDEKVRREVRLFRGPLLNPDGLHAGHIFPDSAFLACVCGLVCHWPQQLRSLFLHPISAVEGRRERAVGAYRLQLCRGGWWENVVVDGFVPASATCPEFSHCADDLRLLWLPLLQKACAKLSGSYAASLNTPLECLVSLLTGGPCWTMREQWPSRDDLRTNTSKATRFFSTLKRLLRTPLSPSSSASPSNHAGPRHVCWLRPYSLTTARSQDTRDKLEKLYSDVGLAPDMATVVLGLETLEDGQCVVRLRQTLETKRTAEAWLAVWRSAKKPWVDSVSDLVFALDDAGGTVWMALEDVPQYFQNGYVAPLTADWASVKVRGCFAQRTPSLALQLEVTVATRVLVTVTQADAEGGGCVRSEKDEKAAATTTTATSRPVAEKAKSEAVKTGDVLAGLGCQAFAAGADGTLHIVTSSSDSADVFEPSAELHFTYERDASVGLVLDPRSNPYVVVPCLHVNSADVPYTITVQAQAEAAEALSSLTPKKASVSVRFVEVKPDAALFQNTARPSLRSSSIMPYPSPLLYQARPLNSRCIVSGEGNSVNLAL